MSGQPIKAPRQIQLKKFEKYVVEDIRFKKKRLSAVVEVSHTIDYRILHDHLGMSKVTARRIPKIRTLLQKEQGIDASKHFRAVW